MMPPTVDPFSKTRNPLLQYDLFQCILDCLGTAEASLQVEEAHLAFFALAQTCHALSEPALDRLWRNLTSLKPLVQCFATVVDEERAAVPPSPTEWAVIRRYSHRIRELSISPFDNVSLYFLQSTSLIPSLLIPNLRVLHWRMDAWWQSSLSILFIRNLLGPSLISLDVFLNDVNSVALQSFLANYPLFCPNLKSISIETDDSGSNECNRASPITITSLSQAISIHDCLEQVNVHIPVNDVALVHIAKSPTVKELALILDPEMSNLYQVHFPPDTIPFRNVEVLSLKMRHLSVFAALLRTQHQMFRSLEISLRSRPTIDTVSTFFAVLSSSQHADHLQTLCLEDNWMRTEMVHQTIIHVDLLWPLTSLRHLCTLEINLGYWISMDDDDLISLARNWPSLQSLSLSWECIDGFPWMFVKYITFKGLLSLLTYCPKLNELVLPLDARQVVKTVDTEWEGVVCNPALDQLFLTDSPITDLQFVKDILDRHFPSVVEVDLLFNSSSTEVEEYEELWNEVDRLLVRHRH